MNREYFRNLVKNDVLVVSDVSEILGVSKQQINNLVRSGSLLPAKETPNGYLFLRDDIEEYLQNKMKSNIRKIRPIFGEGITRRARVCFNRIISNCEQIQNINIYFNSSDAIRDGFYTRGDDYRENKLSRVNAPTFVLICDDGEEYWFDGFNCGYGGEGPNGSYDALIEIGIPEEYARVLFYSEWVRYYREDDGWKVINQERDLDDSDNAPIRSWREESELGSSICLYNQNLVLIQKRMNKYMMDTQPKDFLQKYSYFVPEPVSVSFFTREMALETGHYISSNIDTNYYKIVITDITGRELWLDYPVDEDRPISKQQDLQTILEEMGMVLSEEEIKKLPDRIRKWLKIEPRIVDKLTYVKRK